ncbi:MAG: peroxidase [Planctomycetes bacterium]|nr:peroxidase [Planctomycetota bacterium]
MLEGERDDWLAQIARDWRTAKLARVDHALCVYAEKLTRDPGGMQKQDVDVLRELGLDDARIHDAIQVVAYFNYVNRVADAVHIDLEPEMEPYPEDG